MTVSLEQTCDLLGLDALARLSVKLFTNGFGYSVGVYARGHPSHRRMTPFSKFDNRPSARLPAPGVGKPLASRLLELDHELRVRFGCVGRVLCADLH
jgi:hypothetical protein